MIAQWSGFTVVLPFENGSLGSVPWWGLSSLWKAYRRP